MELPRPTRPRWRPPAKWSSTPTLPSTSPRPSSRPSSPFLVRSQRRSIEERHPIRRNPSRGPRRSKKPTSTSSAAVRSTFLLWFVRAAGGVFGYRLPVVGSGGRSSGGTVSIRCMDASGVGGVARAIHRGRQWSHGSSRPRRRHHHLAFLLDEPDDGGDQCRRAADHRKAIHGRGPL